MADFLIKRIPDNYTKDIIVEADLLYHYIATMNAQKWFPITYIYKTRDIFELFDRMVSKRHFEKVKILFNVNTISELHSKLTKIKEEKKEPIGYGSFGFVQPIYSVINIDTIGTSR
jgi:hypothetical protein